MRLIQLYSNRQEEFATVEFRPGLNVILGEIRHPSAFERDTHNLGKTILARLIDFCLLVGKDKEFFLFKHLDRFREFEFFLEVALDNGGYLTIRRAVRSGSKASLLRHQDSGQDFSLLGKEGWDHWELGFDRAKSLLDSHLALTAIKPWGFRKAIGYSLRTQRDYDEPFALAKYGGKHVEWKPFLAHVLGLNWKLVQENYELASEIEVMATKLSQLSLRLEKTAEDRDQLHGRIEIQRRALASLEAQLDDYNFQLADAEINRALVDELDASAAQLNERRYRLTSDLRRIQRAIEEKAVFNLKRIEKLFADAQVYFGEQIKNDYGQLVEFNKAISEERDRYLAQEARDLQDELGPLEDELESLNSARAEALAALRDKEVFRKYKSLSKRLASQQADLEILEQLFAFFDDRDRVATDLKKLRQRQEAVQMEIGSNLRSDPEIYRSIRAAFDRIVFRVISQHSNLYSRMNAVGNLEFKAEIIDERGQATGATRGFTYGRILCIAFDLAVQLTYLDASYPHFVYHDGFLETLDDRKKLNLIAVAREAADRGVQHIVTVIDSELPKLPDGRRFEFEEDEIALLLHDDGDSGRLFKMEAW